MSNVDRPCAAGCSNRRGPPVQVGSGSGVLVMFEKINLSVLALLFVGLAVSAGAEAATVNAVNCSQSAVQAAVDWAVSGDTVSVPAGSCTWRTAVSIPSAKKITLKGNGVGSTVISMSPVGEVIVAAQSGSRITGFTFQGGTVKVDGDGWRVDSCRFYNATAFQDGVLAFGEREARHPTGLVDHCSFYNSRVLVFGWGGLMAHSLWAQPLGLGGVSGVVYVEDCTFVGTVHSNAIDANYGGRYVFRYNTVTDTYVEAHSVQEDNRAARKWEIYNNRFIQSNREMWVPMFLRGGTGVVFNNTITGTWNTAGIALDNVRDCETRDVSRRCDGSSPWDGNQAGQSGYPCRDQIGRSQDAFLWTVSAPYPPQALDAAYAWNNKHGSGDVLFFLHNNCANHIQSGRDFHNNTAKPGYSPYTYPHPLAQGWMPSNVSPPGNLHVTGWNP